MDRVPDPWPFRGLVLRTPRLELRPDDDAGLLELNEAALAGVHPPASHAGSRTPGHAEHGSAVRVRRGERAVEILLRLDRERFVRPDRTLSVEGLDPRLPVLGL